MKLFKILKVISIMCSIIGLIISLFGLIMGLSSIGESGFEGIGVIFIMPAVIVLLVILFDFLITIDKVKSGLIYSCINSLIKISIIACLIPIVISEYNYEIKFGISNFGFVMVIIIILTMITIPSILNIIKLIKLKKKSLQ